LRSRVAGSREKRKTLEQTPKQPYDELNPPAEPGLIWRHSAVLILLYPRGGEDYLVLMKRTENVAHHKGQISFPGGAREPEDRDLVATALREANEELGIDPEMVQVLGVMPNFYARVSNFIITPVVGRLKPEAGADRLLFQPNANEVAEVIEVPLRVLRDPSIHHTEQRTHNNVTYRIHFYDYDGYDIWGATARIIHEFLAADEYA
jgi:8-oxo-dGTP pyrophosphatase MutT (NUDIX family)